MSKFNKYAQQLDEIARKAFVKYREAESAYRKAVEEENRYPQWNSSPLDGETAAKAAQAHADYLKAKDAWRIARIEYASHTNEIENLRKELAKELYDSFAVDPAKLNTATLELLKSGILTVYEYDKLMREAIADDNITMARLTAKYTNEAATAAETSGDKITATNLRVIANMPKVNTADSYLQVFDELVDTFNRTINNPAMIRHWDGLTAEIVEKF